MYWLTLADPTPPSPEPLPLEDQQPPLEPEDQESAADEAMRMVLMLMPWGISLLLHAGIVLLAIFVVWSVRIQIDEEEVIIPDARLSVTPGVPLQTRTQKTKQTASAQRAVSRSTSQSQANLPSQVNTQTQLLGVAGASGGKSSPFSEAISTGAGFKATFFGTGGNARRIVYLIDASGSLIDSLPYVITELKRSINELSEQQSFSVIFFQGEDVKEVPPPGLRPASAEFKRRTIEWIDLSAGNVVPGGGTYPVKAMNLALQRRPQLLFILSDNITGSGIYQVDQRRLLEDIQRANVSNTKINTIQFLYPDPLTFVGLTATMELIAERSGGRYKFLDAQELGIE